MYFHYTVIFRHYSINNIIRMYPITPRRGNELSAQSSTLGDRTFKPRPERAEAIVGSKAFALSERWRHTLYTQGVALG